jgi:hypothetical protein
LPALDFGRTGTPRKAGAALWSGRIGRIGTLPRPMMEPARVQAAEDPAGWLSS